MKFYHIYRGRIKTFNFTLYKFFCDCAIPQKDRKIDHFSNILFL